MVTISEFQIKDVVNVADGKKLGNITDMDINVNSGKIDAIIIKTGTRVMGLFGKGDEVIIPWRNIVKVGTDVILVRHLASSYEDDDVQGTESPKTFY